MENNFVQSPQYIPVNNNHEPRPPFLLIICILGFVGVGVGAAYYGWGLFNSILMYNVLGSTQDVMGGFGASTYGANDNYSNWIFWSIISNGVCILCEFISLAGLLLIFNRKKPGFFIYAISEVLALGFLVLAAIVTSSMLGGFGLGFGITNPIIMVSLTFIFDAGFIVMHLLNFKHLK